MGLVRAGRRRSREGDEPLLLQRLEALVSLDDNAGLEAHVMVLDDHQDDGLEPPVN